MKDMVQIPTEVAQHLLSRLRFENTELKKMALMYGSRVGIDPVVITEFGKAIQQNESDALVMSVALRKREIADMNRGSWPVDCVQSAFVDGAKWWQFFQNKATAFPSEVDQMADEAERRYGPPEKEE